MTEQAYRALHIGDLHFWRVPLNPFKYWGKRVMGVGNLIVGGRAKNFHQRLAPKLAERLLEIETDTILFSGDFSTTSLSSEFKAAMRTFEPVIEKTRSKSAYVVPGNHDCYTTLDLGADNFAKVLRAPFRAVKGTEFEILNGEIGLLALNATTSNGLNCFGKIVESHLSFVKENVLPRIGEIKTLWILCHFPAEEPPGVLSRDRGDQLRGSANLLDLLKEIPVPMFWLHGHHHYRWAFGSPKIKNLTWINAGAPMLSRKGNPPDLGFHELVFQGGTTHLYSHRHDAASNQWHHRAVRLPEPEEYVNLQDWD